MTRLISQKVYFKDSLTELYKNKNLIIFGGRGMEFSLT